MNSLSIVAQIESVAPLANSELAQRAPYLLAVVALSAAFIWLGHKSSSRMMDKIDVIEKSAANDREAYLANLATIHSQHRQDLATILERYDQAMTASSGQLGVAAIRLGENSDRMAEVAEHLEQNVVALEEFREVTRQLRASRG